jgi:hypothetical protein
MQNTQDQMLYVSVVWLAPSRFSRMRGRIIRLGADALAGQTMCVGRLRRTLRSPDGRAELDGAFIRAIVLPAL